MKATLTAFICTFFEIFNVPVFWPILVMYFIVLTCLTMKRQIMVQFWFENQTFILFAENEKNLLLILNYCGILMVDF